jgi:plastocyanin
MIRNVSWLAVTAVLSVALLAACGSDDDEADPTATRVPATNAPVTSTQTVGPSASSSPAAQGSPAGSTAGIRVAIEMQDIKFRPTEITIPANTAVTVDLANTGAAIHNFNVDDLDVHSGDYEAGEEGSVTITAAPGEYEFHCSIPGHKEAGMVGKLIVR